MANDSERCPEGCRGPITPIETDRFGNPRYECEICGTRFTPERKTSQSDSSASQVDEPMPDSSDEDPEWKGTEFFVPIAKPSGRSIKDDEDADESWFEQDQHGLKRLTEEERRYKMLERESYKDTGFNPNRESLLRALRYLDANRSSRVKNSQYRRALFHPFYGIEWDYGQKGEFEKKITSESTIPGPICVLVYVGPEGGTNLPPRRYWLRSSIPEDGIPNTPPDSIPERLRIDLEMFIHLNAIRSRPWSLRLWAERLECGSEMLGALQKGGAISRLAGQYLYEFDKYRILEKEISGFVDNITELGFINLNEHHQRQIIDSSLNILNSMNRTKTATNDGEMNLLEAFIKRACLISTGGIPTEFWRIQNKKRQSIGNMSLKIIPIALAVAESIAKLGQSEISPEVIRKLAYADLQSPNRTNCGSREDLDSLWKYCIRKISLN